MNISTLSFSRSPWEIDCSLVSEARQSHASTIKKAPAKEIAAETGDVLELSQESQAAADAANKSTGLRSLLGDLSKDLFASEAELQESGSALQGKIQSFFAADGIDTSNKIDLQIGYDGRVIVANDNPQRAKIEQIFEEHPSLRDDFAKYSAQTSLLNAAKEASAFQKAYARDPQSAVAQFSYLFDAANKPVVSMTVENGSYRTLLEYPNGKNVEAYK